MTWQKKTELTALRDSRSKKISQRIKKHDKSFLDVIMEARGLWQTQEGLWPLLVKWVGRIFKNCFLRSWHLTWFITRITRRKQDKEQTGRWFSHTGQYKWSLSGKKWYTLGRKFQRFWHIQYQTSRVDMRDMQESKIKGSMAKTCSDD